MSDVKECLRIQPNMPAEYEVMINIYAHKQGLAKRLVNVEWLPSEAHLEDFFTKFNQSHPLLHFVECGPGKESADAKLRGMSVGR